MSPALFPESTLRLTQGEVLADPDVLWNLRQEFEETGCAILPGFLAPPVLYPLLHQTKIANFELTQEANVRGATFLMPNTEPALRALHFILNRPELFRAVAQVGSTPRLGNFHGRLHQTFPDSDQHLDWHDDAVDGRMIGLNINLSTEEYTGGLLQLRGPDQLIRREIGQLPAGDAFLFRIGGRWQHRLTRLESGCRTVAVGWFRTSPDWEMIAMAGFLAGKVILDEAKSTSEPEESDVV